MKQRGTTLIEVMVALTVLLVGLIGMLQAQLLGATSDQGARANLRAMAVAEDLLAALERVPYNDPTFMNSDPAPSTTPPPMGAFGSLLWTLGSATYHDEVSPPGPGLPPGAMPLCPAATPSALGCVELDPQQPTLPLYHRRWVVWWDTAGSATYSGQVPVKMISVSVIYHEQTIQTSKEVVVYDQRYFPPT